MTHISRRVWLKGVALVSAAAATPLKLASTPAEAKGFSEGTGFTLRRISVF